MIVKVTQKHISCGVVGNDYRCPIALALQDVTNDTWRVCGQSLRRIRDGSSFNTPNIAKLFIDQFDKNYPCSPFEFELS